MSGRAKTRWLFLFALAALTACLSCGGDSNPTDGGSGDPDTTFIATHEAADRFDLIPMATVAQVASELNICYGHTSHGSQIMTGLDMVEAGNNQYAQPYIHEISDDLGHLGDTTWMEPTRAWLAAHPECNVVMWSWCGGCSDNTPTGIDIYLNAMNSLETAYPNVQFVYMTGHLDGTGPGGTLYANNNRIRDYCAANGKILFDFADIESYDPDGTYYPDGTDACEWCSDWCLTHSCDACSVCAHSHCFNCYQKGRAFWWLMARLVGREA